MKQNERRIELSKQSIYLIMMCVLDLLVGVTLGVKIIDGVRIGKKSRRCVLNVAFQNDLV